MVAALQRGLVLGLLLGLGCATGGRADGGPPPTRDSGMGGFDAGRPSADGGYRPDTYVRPDGGTPRFDSGVVRADGGGFPVPDSGGFPSFDGSFMFMCMSTADCAAMPGTCCAPFINICVPGMEMFGICNPF